SPVVSGFGRTVIVRAAGRSAKASAERQALLEPMVRVRLAVEGGDLDVARSPVQRDRLAQVAVGLEPYHRRTRFARVALELVEQPPAEAEAARGRCDPHPLQLRRLVSVKLHRAAPDRLA